MTINTRRAILGIIGVALALAVAIPVLGADPSPSSAPSASAKPEKSAKLDKPPKAAKPDKVAKGPEVTTTVTGVVQQATDDKGRATFSLTDGSTTWELSAGPPWFWGDKNPLTASVGKTVTIVGTSHEGETEIDVTTVDGTALREPGKPPWAGGPWAVGSTHPGWKPWMADGKPGNGHGRENAPGQNKDKTPDPSP